MNSVMKKILVPFPAVNVSLSMSANTVIACPYPHPPHI